MGQGEAAGCGPFVNVRPVRRRMRLRPTEHARQRRRAREYYERKFQRDVRAEPGESTHSSRHDPDGPGGRCRPDVVIVNVGLKSEAVIPLDQFKNERGEIEVKAGEQVEVALDSVEDGTGETRLSREKAKRARTWTRLEQAFNAGEIVTGIISGRVKGGFTVEIDHVRAFLPGSLVDVRPVRDTAYLEGKPLEFKVIKLDQKRNNVVVSRRAVVEQEFSAERSALMDNLQEGAVVRGSVKNLTDYGAFVDLGGIDGLLHITDMAWKRVKHPSEVVKVGRLRSTCASSNSIASARASRWASSSSARIRGRTSRGAIRRTRACSARSPTSPTTAPSSRSRTASRAWCTSRRWTGPTRTSIRPRWCIPGRKSKSWCWTSTRSGAASRWA